MLATPEKISLGRPADAVAMARMSRDYIEFGLGWKWTAARVLACMRDPATNVAVFRAGVGLGGFAIMKYNEDEAHLLLFAVDASYRRRGIGSALLGWLEATAVTAGIGLVYLEARVRNEGARAFYRHHGYREVARIHGMYRGVEDGLRIAKDLWMQSGPRALPAPPGERG